MGQSRTLCGQLDLGGATAPQNDEPVHDDPGDSGQDDDAGPVRHTYGGGDRGEVGDPQSLDPCGEAGQDSRLRRSCGGGVGHEREPGADQAFAGAVVGACGAASGQDDPDSEEKGTGDGGDH